MGLQAAFRVTGLETVSCDGMSRILAAIIGVLSVLGLVLGLTAYTNTSPTGAAAATIEVKRATTGQEVIAELERRGLIRNGLLFRAVMRISGTDRGIRDGYYDLNGDMSAFAIAKALSKGGRPRVTKIVIPEGWRLSEIINRLSEKGFGTKAKLEQAFADTSLIPEIKNVTDKPASLEGFVFPATYEINPDDTPAQVAAIMIKRMRQEFTPERLAVLNATGLSVYKWVLIASLVQVEAGNTEEMPLIAGVFLNRIDAGMPFQSDPTIAYGLGKKLPELDRSAGDFEKDTPYNSYTRKMIAGPIGSPGVAALQAVIKPDRKASWGEPWLYFLHGTKGQFKVNTNFNAHLRDTNRFR